MKSNPQYLTEEESSSADKVQQVLRDQEDRFFIEIVYWGVDDNPAEGVNHFFWRDRTNDTNLPDKSELKVDVFPDDDKAESAVLAALAGRTGIVHGPAIIGKKRQIILLSRPGPAVPVGPQDALSRLLAEAKAEYHVLSTKDDPDTDHGKLGCADAVTRILKKLGFPIRPTPSTVDLKNELVAAGWQTVDLNTPGAVIVSPTCPAMHGHTGIVGENGVIYSNRSNSGLWDDYWTVHKWKENYAPCGFYAFAPPADAAPAPAATGGTSPAPAEGTPLYNTTSLNISFA